MGCLPNSQECDRQIIAPFVHYLNELEGTAYAFKSCPDKTIRNRPQPETLYIDPANTKRLVIERKTLIWPLDYAERHVADHYLMNAIKVELEALTKDAPYALELRIGTAIDREELKHFAGLIVNAVKPLIGKIKPGEGVTSRDLHWPFRFWLEGEDERDFSDPPKGLGITLLHNPSTELDNPDQLPTGLVSEINKRYHECEGKFAEYELDRKILIFEPHGDLKYWDDSWWERASARVQPPKSISEVWLAIHDYVTELDKGWMFTKLYPDFRNCVTILE